MIIGVDIDGVLANYSRFLYDHVSKYLNKKPLKKCYEVKEVYGLSSDEEMKVWQDNYDNYVKNIDALWGSAKFLRFLRKNNHKVYLITNRGFDAIPGTNYEKAYNQTEKWLKKHHFEYDKLILTKGLKLNECKACGVEIMLEDSPYQIENVSQGIPVIIIDTDYNREVNNDNTYRCKSYREVKKTFIELSKKIAKNEQN